MHSFLSFTLEEGYINFGDYNLEQKFHHYNQILFDNSIPLCPIVWNENIRVGSKEAAGLTTFSHRNRELIPGTMKIQISTRFKRSEEMLDSTLIHEMIHAYWAVHGFPDEQHGMRFKALAYKCQKMTGIEIPVTDTLTNLELTNEKNVETTVLFRHYAASFRQPEGWYAIFYNGTAFDDARKQDELKAFWGFPGKMKEGEEILVIKVHGSYIAKYGGARTIKQDTWRGVSNSEAEEILQHGRIMFKITAGSVSKETAIANFPTKEALIVLKTNTRTHETIGAFYVPQIAHDLTKLTVLRDHWKEWHKMGYDVDIFLTHSNIFSRGFSMQRDPKSARYYMIKGPTVDDLRKNARYIEQWRQ